MMSLLLLLACSGDDPTTPTTPAGLSGDTGATTEPVDPAALAAELSAPGPHSVGYRTVDIVWTDPLLTDGEPRTLRTSLWYPTSATSGDDAKYQDLFIAEGVWVDAPLVPGEHPVAVFSHGHQAYGEASGFLMEHLASHGWVVAAPDHTGNLTWDGGDRDTEIYLQRPLDVSATLDWLDDPVGDVLAGQLGPERVAIGHSFGGFTLHAVAGATWSDAAIDGCDDGTAFCSTMTPELAARLRQGFDDPRLDAVVSMAPGDYRLFEQGLADIDVPVLLMAGGLDDATDSNAVPIWSVLDGADDRYAYLPDLGHNGFTDFAGSLDPAGAEDPEVGFATVRGLVLAFALQHTAGLDTSALLDGTVPVGEATVSWPAK
jgi:predicted dienelactone hydrolase